MTGYIVALSVTALVTAVLEIFAPKEWEKYIKFGIGLIIISTVLAPIQNLRPGKIAPEKSSYDTRGEDFYEKIKSGLRENVEKDIETRLREEFGVSVSAKAEIETDENNNIKGVKSIEVTGNRIPAEIRERLEEVYGCRSIEIRPE